MPARTKEPTRTMAYLHSLDVAALQFKLSVHVKGAALSKSLPQKCVGMVHSGLSLAKDDLALTPDEAAMASTALQHCATYLLVVAIDTAFEKVWRKKRFDSDDQKIATASKIAYILRNSFAHDPFYPTWKFGRSDRFVGRFEISDVMEIDTSHLCGRRVEPEHYGGPIKLLHFLEYSKQLLINHESA